MSNLRVAKQKSLMKYSPYWKTVFRRMNTEHTKVRALWNPTQIHCICNSR